MPPLHRGGGEGNHSGAVLRVPSLSDTYLAGQLVDPTDSFQSRLTRECQSADTLFVHPGPRTTANLGVTCCPTHNNPLSRFWSFRADNGLEEEEARALYQDEPGGAVNQVANDHFRVRQSRLDCVHRCLKRVGAGVMLGITAGGLAGQPIAQSEAVKPERVMLEQAESPAPAPVISEIRSSTVGGKFAIEIVASTPFSYAVLEAQDPFRLTLYIPNAKFAFPLTPLTLRDAPLIGVVPAEVKREDGTLGQIELTFVQAAPYTVTRDETTLTVTVDLPAQGGVVTLFGRVSPQPVVEPPPPQQTPATQEAPRVKTDSAQPSRETPAQALAPPSRPEQTQTTTVNRLRLTSTAEVATLQVNATGRLEYRVTTLAFPPRLVVDLLGALYPPLTGAVPGQGPVVTRVRVSQFRGQPQPIVRIVLDLVRPVPYRIQETDEGLLIHAETKP